MGGSSALGRRVKTPRLVYVGLSDVLVPEDLDQVLVLVLDALGVGKVLAYCVFQDVSLNCPVDSALDEHQLLLFVCDERV